METTLVIFTLSFYFLFLVVLMIVPTVATSLYLYFQALCQVIASYDKGSESCDMLSKNRFCLRDGENRIKSPVHIFELNFLQSVLYKITEQSYVLSFLI